MNRETEIMKPACDECEKGISLKSATVILYIWLLQMGCLVIITALFWMKSSQHIILIPLVALAGAALCWLSGVYYGGLKKR